MRPQDRELARRALEEGRITVDQVTSIRQECEKSGRPFADVALERGIKIAPAPKPRPPKAITPLSKIGSRSDLLLLAGAIVVLTAILIVSGYRVASEWGQDDAITEEMALFRDRADRRALEVRREYARGRVDRRHAEVQAALDGAREALAYVEKRMANGEDGPELYIRLTEAEVGFTRWITSNPEDAGVRIERGRAYDLRKDYAKAIADLERAGELDAKVKPTLRDRIEKLRILLAQSFAPEK